MRRLIPLVLAIPLFVACTETSVHLDESSLPEATAQLHVRVWDQTLELRYEALVAPTEFRPLALEAASSETLRSADVEVVALDEIGCAIARGRVRAILGESGRELRLEPLEGCDAVLRVDSDQGSDEDGCGTMDAPCQSVVFASGQGAMRGYSRLTLDAVGGREAPYRGGGDAWDTFTSLTLRAAPGTSWSPSNGPRLPAFHPFATTDPADPKPTLSLCCGDTPSRVMLDGLHFVIRMGGRGTVFNQARGEAGMVGEVRNCRIEEDGPFTVHEERMLATAMRPLVIYYRYNHIEGFSAPNGTERRGVGIQVRGTVAEAVVEGNVVLGADIGLALAAETAVVRGNLICSEGGIGIRVSGATVVENNTVLAESEGSGVGIEIDGRVTALRGNVVMGMAEGLRGEASSSLSSEANHFANERDLVDIDAERITFERVDPDYTGCALLRSASPSGSLAFIP